MSGDLKDQLKAWKADHKAPDGPSSNGPSSDGQAKKAKTPGLTPKQARRAAARAQRDAADAKAQAREEELASLSDDELFEKAIDDIGDGSVAILKKYGHGHLSGEGEPEPAPAHERAAAEPEEEGKPAAGETNLFLDVVGDIKPLKR